MSSCDEQQKTSQCDKQQTTNTMWWKKMASQCDEQKMTLQIWQPTIGYTMRWTTNNIATIPKNNVTMQWTNIKFAMRQTKAWLTMFN